MSAKGNAKVKADVGYSGVALSSQASVGGGVGAKAAVGGGTKVAVAVAGTQPKSEILVNSGVPEEKNSTPEMSGSLRSYSVCANCIRCNTPAATRTEPSYNVINCLFGYFCFQLWCCFECYNKKDYNCWNVRHRCGNCGIYIDTYSAC